MRVVYIAPEIDEQEPGKYFVDFVLEYNGTIRSERVLQDKLQAYTKDFETLDEAEKYKKELEDNMLMQVIFPSEVD